MNTNNFAIKFKRYAVLGISLLGLAAMGCGGGSGTLVSNPTFGIPAPAGGSLQTTAGAKKSLASIGTGNLTVYSLDGTVVAPATSVTLPHTVTVSGDLYTKAFAQGALVVRINNNTGLDYTAVVKLDRTDLAANGPIVDADGTSRQEPVDPQSTVRTALIEAELERETGQVVRLGTEASAEVRLALANVVDSSNDGSNAVAVGAIADSLKSAAGEADSLIAKLSQEASTASTSDGVNAQDSIRNFLTKGTSPRLKSARRLMKASTKLSRQARKRNSAAAKTFLANLAKSTEADATANAAGASVVAAALDLSEKEAGLKTEAEALLNAADLKTAVAEAAATVLPLITTELAVSLNSQNASDEIAELVGGVIAGSDSTDAQGAAALSTGLAVLNTVIAVADDTTKKKLFGASLAATADNTASAKELIQNVASDELSVSDAINAVSADVDVADVVDVVADVITALGGAPIAGLDSSVTALVNDLQNLDGDDLAAIAANTEYLAADAACLKGFSCGAADGTLTVKTGDLVSLFNSSVFGTGTYTYEWTVAPGVGTGVTKSADQLEFTAAGSGAVTLTQSLAGVEINTFTLYLTALKTLNPVVELDGAELRLKPGKSAALLANIYDPEGKSLQNAVTVKNCDGTAATGFTEAISASGLVTVSAAADVAVGVYCGTVTASTENGSRSQVETFDVYVEAFGAPVLTLSGVSDTTTGTVSNIILTGFSEDPNASGTLTLSVMSGGNLVAVTTAAIAKGNVSTSVTLTNDTVGTFMVTGQATGAEDVNSVYTVKELGAPSFDEVTANGLTVKSGSFLEYEVSAGGTVTVTVNASATVADGTVVSYSVAQEDMSGSVVNTVTSTDGVNMEVTGLGAGTHILVITATDDNNKSVVRTFAVEVTKLKEFEVAGVLLEGVTASTLTTAMSGGKYVIDAADVQGLSLDNSGLRFTVTGASTDQTLSSTDYTVTVNLLTPGTDLREASIEIIGAQIVVGAIGYDLTSATQLVLKATKSDGVTKATYSAPSSAISNFDVLFDEDSNGLVIDIAELKNAIKTDVISSVGSFYQSLDTLTGSGLTVEVTIKAPEFSFKSGNYNFNTFVIKNITVE